MTGKESVDAGFFTRRMFLRSVLPAPLAGIGLSLARTLARRLGGDVVLDTSYSFGARFVFSLPL